MVKTYLGTSINYQTGSNMNILGLREVGNPADWHMLLYWITQIYDTAGI